jgi:hypothetical protein
MAFIKLYCSLPSDQALRLVLNFSLNLLGPSNGLLTISYKSSCIGSVSRLCTGISPATGRSVYLSDGSISNSPVHRRKYISTLAINLAHPRASTWTNTFHRPLNSWFRSSTSKAERGAGPAKALASTIHRLKADRRGLPRHRQNSGSFAQAEKSRKDNSPLFETGSDLGRPAG